MCACPTHPQHHTAFGAHAHAARAAPGHATTKPRPGAITLLHAQCEPGAALHGATPEHSHCPRRAQPADQPRRVAMSRDCLPAAQVRARPVKVTACALLRLTGRLPRQAQRRRMKMCLRSARTVGPAEAPRPAARRRLQPELARWHGRAERARALLRKWWYATAAARKSLRRRMQARHSPCARDAAVTKITPLSRPAAWPAGQQAGCRPQRSASIRGGRGRGAQHHAPGDRRRPRGHAQRGGLPTSCVSSARPPSLPGAAASTRSAPTACARNHASSRLSRTAAGAGATAAAGAAPPGCSRAAWALAPGSPAGCPPPRA